MKQYITFVLLFVGILFGFSQNLKSDKYSLYINDIGTSEVNISKGMYMTENKQYFHDGKIEVNDLETNKTTMYQFYFSVWDKKYKEFIVRGLDYKKLSVSYTFEDNDTIKYTDKDGKVIKLKLKDSSSLESAILSSFLIWLENK
jgi:hypothetical protein